MALTPWPPRHDPTECDDPIGRFVSALETTPVEIAVVSSCQWELLDQRLPGDDTVRAIGDPAFDAVVEQRYRDTTAALRAAGVARVVWMRCPHFGVHDGTDVPAALATARRPERVDRLNALLERIAADEPGLELLCFDQWVNARRDDPALRPDGAHFDIEHPNAALDELAAQLNAVVAGRPACP